MSRNSCHHQSFCQLALVGMLMLHAEVNTLRPRQMTIIFQTTLSNSFSWMKMLEVWLKFHWSLYLKVQLIFFWSLVQMKACRRPGDKPLSEPVMVRLSTHICVTRSQLVKWKVLSYSIVMLCNIVMLQYISNDTSKFLYNGFCCTQESNEEGRSQIIFVAEKWSCTVIYVVPFSGGGRLGRLCVACGRISISTTLQNPYQIHCKYFLLIPWHVWCRCSPWKAL